MPGSFIFRPIEANLKHNTNWIDKMDPYCVFYVDNKRIASQICRKGGKHPTWTDSITVPFTNQSVVTAQVMDKDKVTKDDPVGTFNIDLKEVEAFGRVNRWYPIFFKNKPAGEIHLEAFFQGNSMGSQNLLGSQQGRLSQIGFVQSQVMTRQPQGILKTEPNVNSSPVRSKRVFFSDQKVISTDNLQSLEENVIVNTPRVKEPSRVFIEQRQSVTPHKFLKEVEQLETRPSLRQVEIMQPRKVVKDVQYTELVPVKKTVETFEPRVVTKEVEVLEPRLVTKQIQVVENVRVMRKIEVIETVPVVKEIEVLEPQTLTKQVEITEYVPVMADVTVTELVPVKRALEFMEPVITTQTITKEIQESVVVDEQVTKSVGPAMLVGEMAEKTVTTNQGNYRESLGGIQTNILEQNVGGSQAKFIEQDKNQVVRQPVVMTPTYSTTYQQMGLGGEKLTGFERSVHMSNPAKNPRHFKF